MITAFPAKLGGLIQCSAEIYNPRTLRHSQSFSFQVEAKSESLRHNALVIPLPADYSKGIDISFLPRDTLSKISRPLVHMIETISGDEHKDHPFRGVRKNFDVAVASSAETVASAIADLPESVRPPINRNLMLELGKLYSGWPIAICSWVGTISSDPIVFCFEPLNPYYLHFPGVSRRGSKLDPLRDVDRDTVLLFGSSLNPVGLETKLPSEDSGGYIPSKIWGRSLQGDDFNGDYRVRLNSLRELVDIKESKDLHSRLNPGLWSLGIEYYNPSKSREPKTAF